MLSLSQFAKKTPRPMESLTVKGAMPIDTRFNGAAPIKTPSQNGKDLPNQGMSIPKPGFF